MNWIEITSDSQLSEIQKDDKPSIIFKHSTRCPVSKVIKSNFVTESILLPDDVKVYHLDLIKYRDLSNQIAQYWNIKHESPQVLLIQNNECHYDASHNNIHVADIVTQIKE
jgi:bacillithiol system protein YtxJ